MFNGAQLSERLVPLGRGVEDVEKEEEEIDDEEMMELRTVDGPEVDEEAIGFCRT